MHILLWGLVAVVVISVVWRKLQLRTVERLVADAIRSDDVAPLVAAVGDIVTPTARQNAFHLAASRLWMRHHRALAMRFIQRATPHVGAALTTQYWIRQSLEVEPDLAREIFDGEFLETQYHPRVAQQCGSFG